MPVRAWVWRHPQWWVYALCLLAWLGLAGNAAMTSPNAAQIGLTDALCGVPSPSGSPWSEWRHWAVMVVAMMFPLAAIQAQAIAQVSLWRRRHLAMVWFLFAYWVTWMLARVAYDLLLNKIMPWPSSNMAAVALMMGAVWQITPYRRKAAARCHQRQALPMHGWRANVACLRQGMHHGLDCLALCWPVMVACIYLPHDLMIMSGLTGLVLADRYARPDQAKLAPILFLAAALLVNGLAPFDPPVRPKRPLTQSEHKWAPTNHWHASDETWRLGSR